jgi:hypothetical protein
MKSNVLHSLDQTTRIHGLLPTNAWRELARPQVHGYDLVGVQFLDALKFVSIADEKVARVFEAPKAFVRLAKSLRLMENDIDEVDPCLPLRSPSLILSSRKRDRSERPFLRWAYLIRPSARLLHSPRNYTLRSQSARRSRESWLL